MPDIGNIKTAILERVGRADNLRNVVAELTEWINAVESELTKTDWTNQRPTVSSGDLLLCKEDAWAGTFTVLFRVLVYDALESDSERLHFTMWTIDEGTGERYIVHKGYASPGALDGDTFTFGDGYTLDVNDIVAVLI